MMELAKVGTNAFAALGVGAVLAIILPITIALIWKFKKKERFTTILIGVAAFVLFAMIIEKLIQNVLIFPTQMMLPDHVVSRFINARPLLWALVVALFPGVFEETGRLIAFKTVLRKRKNRETSISYGIGHGCGEAIILLGITYIEYIVFAVMINLGTFQTVIDQATATDKNKTWLYPLAIILHTAMDFIAALTLTGIWTPSTWLLEAIVAVFGILVFCGAYFLLYRKDKG